MMRWFNTALILAGLAVSAPVDVGGTPAARYSKPAVRRALVAVVEAQLTALRNDDWAKAYGFAAAALQERLTIEQFAAMIQRNYPAIWHSTRADYGFIRDDDRMAWVPVRVSTPPESAAYDYGLIHESGGWKIAGVLPARRTEGAAEGSL